MSLDIQAAIRSLIAYGTSEGVEKAWDTRGRGRKDEGDFRRTSNSVVLSFGRFNPPHRGHTLVFDKLAEVAKQQGADAVLFVNPKQNNTKDPLTIDDKLKYIRMMAPDIHVQYKPKSEVPDPEDIVKLYSDQGYKHLTIVEGGDRAEWFKNLIQPRMDKGEYKFKDWNFVNAADRDKPESWSSTKQRDAAVRGDYAAFTRGLPENFPADTAKEMYDKVRTNLGVHVAASEQTLNIRSGIQQLVASMNGAAGNPRKPIPDTGEYNELHEKAVRDLAEKLGYYAEAGPLFDPEGCYDRKTRVLTRRGFKPFYSLRPDDEIATLVDGKRLVYERPLASTKYWYEGPMYQFRTRCVNLLVTPKHKVYWRNGHSNQYRLAVGRDEIPFELTSAQDLATQLTNWQSIQFKRNLEWHCSSAPAVFIVPPRPDSKMVGIYKKLLRWDGTSKEFARRHGIHPHTARRWRRGEYSPQGAHRTQPKEFKFDDWLELLGWYLSEGSTASKVDRVVISQRKQQNRVLIANLLQRMGIQFYSDKDGFNFYHSALCAYLATFGASYEKFVPSEIRDLPPSKLEIILRSLVLGDGHWGTDAISGRYTSVSQRLAEHVAEIALKCGYSISLSHHQASGRGWARLPSCTVRFSKFRQNAKCGKPKTIDYKGWVYCVQVSSGVLLVEREGRVCWSGNSYLCSDCCLRQEPKACTHVSGKISMETGSCMIWVIGDEINEPVGQKLTQIESNYSERPKAKGFGCSRCGWAKDAKKPDDDGRGLWCGWWGCRVRSLACCFAESGPDLKVAPGE